MLVWNMFDSPEEMFFLLLMLFLCHLFQRFIYKRRRRRYWQ